MIKINNGYQILEPKLTRNMNLIKSISDSKRKRSNSDSHRHHLPKTLTRLISHECWFVIEMALHSSKPVVIDDTDTITEETILHFVSVSCVHQSNTLIILNHQIER